MTNSSPSWISRNAFLVAAAGLPAVVVLFFLAATQIPKWTVDDPVHDVVFAMTRHDYTPADIILEFKMEVGQLVAVARRVPQNGYKPYQQLYRYHVQTGALEALEVEVPEDVRERLMGESLVAGETPPSETFVPPLFGDTRLLSAPIAPDGYTFEHQLSGGRGLFGELFGIGRRPARVGLSKNGRMVTIEPPNGRGHYYYSSVFLAWVGEPS